MGQRSGASFDRRCFNCSGPECTVATCKEPRNQGKIEANLKAWLKSRGIDLPLKHVNLADVNAPSYLIAEVMAAEIYLEHVTGSNNNNNGSFSGSMTNSATEEARGFDVRILSYDYDTQIFAVEETESAGATPEVTAAVSMDEMSDQVSSLAVAADDVSALPELEYVSYDELDQQTSLFDHSEAREAVRLYEEVVSEQSQNGKVWDIANLSLSEREELHSISSSHKNTVAGAQDKSRGAGSTEHCTNHI